MSLEDEKNKERGKTMRLINFILWLSVGAIIGWFAGQILKERKQTVMIEPVREVQLAE